MPVEVRELSPRHGEGDDAAAPVVLEATGIRHAFGSTPVLRGVDLTIHAGECVVLRGPNGAGKTTLVRILATLLRPRAGTLTIAGMDARREPLRARAQLGMVGDRSLLSGELTARENLRFYARLYGLRPVENAVEAALAQLDASALADRLVRTLSTGMQQRVALARAILHDPLILLLDEPEAALDEASQARLAALLDARRVQGRSAVVVSHRAEWSDAVASRVVGLRDGLLAPLDGALP